MKDAFGYICTFVAGCVACVLIVGWIASSIIGSTVKDCELAGAFRHDDKVVTCSVEDKARK